MPRREPLDEMALRRPEFRPGTPVKLADGQEWELRKPIVSFIPHEGPVGFVVKMSLDSDDDFQELLDEYRALFADGKKPTAFDMIAVEFALAKRVLLANYGLSAEQVARLLQFSYDEELNPEHARLRDDVMDLVLGNGPKPSPDGDDSSPTPSGESLGATA